jgi:hypothetical protein
MPARTYLKVFAVVVAGLVGSVALVAAALVAWLTIMDPFDGGSHPTDAAMLAHFAKVRPALDELVGMLRDDPAITRLAADFTRPDPAPLTAARLATYRSRLDDAGITHGISRRGDAVFFLVSTRGLAISGSGKGFVSSASADPDAIVVDGDLDAATAALADKDVLLQRPVAAGWWLQLDRR